MIFAKTWTGYLKVKTTLNHPRSREFDRDCIAPEYPVKRGQGEERHDKAPFGCWTTHSPRTGMNGNLCKDVKQQIEENVPMSFCFGLGICFVLTDGMGICRLLGVRSTLCHDSSM